MDKLRENKSQARYSPNKKEKLPDWNFCTKEQEATPKVPRHIPLTEYKASTLPDTSTHNSKISVTVPVLFN
jgi:hypothetical protein